MPATYDGLLSEIYDDYIGEDVWTDLPVWKGLAREAGGNVLELGCGTGRLLLPLCAGGLPVEGLDNSADMLAECRRRGRDSQLDLPLHLSDMTSFKLEHRYHLIFCAAGSFTLLAEPGAMEAGLRSARAHLITNGQIALMMDAPRPSSAGRQIVRDLIRRTDGARLRCVLDTLPSNDNEVARYEMTNEIIAVDGTKREAASEIAFRRPSPARMRKLVAEAGFRDVQILDAAGAGPLLPGAHSYLVIGRV